MTIRQIQRESCRLCDSRECELVVPLEASAIADAYVPAERLQEPQETYPLDLFLCRSCSHLQLLNVIDPETLFADYIYTTSSSPGLVEHFRGYAQDLEQRIGFQEGALAVDIGSNEGVLLRLLQEAGVSVLGVDPAREIAASATQAGIPTIPSFFTFDLARHIRDDHGPATIVTANNVFAHSDALGDISDGIRHVLTPDGVFVFEVSYLLNLVENMVFDYVYHEHLSYHAVKPLQTFFARHGMELFDVQRIPTKGGSIRGFAQLHGGPRAVSESVEELLTQERVAGLDQTATFHSFAERIALRKDKVRGVLRNALVDGSTIAGYGASATVTTLMYQFKLNEFISFIVDDNADRQGLFSPGHHLPVLSPDSLYEQTPDYVVILAWRFAEPIVKRHQDYLKNGGRFLIPLPEVRVLDGHSSELPA